MWKEKLCVILNAPTLGCFLQRPDTELVCSFSLSNNAVGCRHSPFRGVCVF